jgi:hypothetical protein
MTRAKEIIGQLTLVECHDVWDGLPNPPLGLGLLGLRKPILRSAQLPEVPVGRSVGGFEQQRCNMGAAAGG